MTRQATTGWRRRGRRVVADSAVLAALIAATACVSSGLPDPGVTPGGVTTGPTVGSTASPAAGVSAGPTPTRTGNPPPPEPGPGVGDELVVRRTGGIAGVDQRLAVRPDGTWTFVDRGASQRGMLSAAQLDQLRRLLSDPRLLAEVTRPAPADCADAFHYEFAAGDLTAEYADCSNNADFPVLSQIIALLIDATPL